MAITLTVFPYASIDAIFSSLVVHTTSFLSAFSFVIVALNTWLLPIYKLLTLLFITTFSTKVTFSFTVTFIVFVATPPSLSTTLYVTVYSPGVSVLTLFSTTSISVISPCSSSVAVTPSNSLNSSPTVITLSSACITGGWFTTTSISCIAVAPCLSVTLNTTV